MNQAPFDRFSEESGDFLKPEFPTWFRVRSFHRWPGDQISHSDICFFQLVLDVEKNLIKHSFYNSSSDALFHKICQRKEKSIFAKIISVFINCSQYYNLEILAR